MFNALDFNEQQTAGPVKHYQNYSKVHPYQGLALAMKPTTYLDAWRSGARVACRALADRTDDFLTMKMREVALTKVFEDTIKERKRLEREPVDLVQSMPQWFDAGAQFVLSLTRDYDVAFLTDQVMEAAIMNAEKAVESAKYDLFF
jgi:hypothetical protein